MQSQYSRSQNPSHALATDITSNIHTNHRTWRHFHFHFHSIAKANAIPIGPPHISTMHQSVYHANIGNLLKIQ